MWGQTPATTIHCRSRMPREKVRDNTVGLEERHYDANFLYEPPEEPVVQGGANAPDPISRISRHVLK